MTAATVALFVLVLTRMADSSWSIVTTKALVRFFSIGDAKAVGAFRINNFRLLSTVLSRHWPRMTLRSTFTLNCCVFLVKLFSLSPNVLLLGFIWILVPLQHLAVANCNVPILSTNKTWFRLSQLRRYTLRGAFHTPPCCGLQPCLRNNGAVH